MDKTFSEFLLDDIENSWRSFGGRVLEVRNSYEELPALSLLGRVWALFRCAQQLAWLVAWFPLLIVLTLLALALVLIVQAFPFVAAAVVLWLGYDIVRLFFPPPLPPPALPAERPVYQPADVETYPPTGFPEEAEAELP
jgi:hypothetical protein